MLNMVIRSAADVLVLVLLFGVTIFVHEFGHFLLALKLGLKVTTFSIGFGPALWQTRRKGITYKIGCIPVGGYVALPQLDPSAMSTVQGGADAAEQALPPAAPWKRIVVSASGATGNMLFAVLLAWVVYLSPEAVTDDGGSGTLVGYVETNSAAYAAGLRPGDTIVAVNGEKVAAWSEYTTLCVLGSGSSNRVTLTLSADGAERQVAVPTAENDMGVHTVEGIGKASLCVVNAVVPGGSAEAAGVREGDLVRIFGGVRVAGTEHFIQLVESRSEQATDMTVERGGETLTVNVTPHYNAVHGRALIGVSVGPGLRSMVMPWMQYKRPMAQIRGDAMGIVRILRALVTPREARRAAEGLGGPIMIIAALWVSIKISPLNAVGFLRFLNVNLAILNLLPIPVLDGGHILFSAWEWLTRRRVHPRVVNVLVNVFAVLLIGLLLLLSVRDARRVPRMFRAFNGGGQPESGATNAPAPAATNAPAAGGE